MVGTTRERGFDKRMRWVWLAGLLLAAMASGSRVSSQGPTIVGYKLVSELPLTPKVSRFTLRPILRNPGGALASATGKAKTTSSAILLVDDAVSFGPVGQGGLVTSTDTFSFLRNKTAAFEWTSITWTIATTPNHPPLANAGPDFTRRLTQTAQLDGSGSSDVDGNRLTYFWSFLQRPAGSLAALSDPTAVKPTFVVDRPGPYVVQLVVNDGFANSTRDVMAVTTINSPPVANAGPDQTAFLRQTVTLNGSGSSDVDGNALTFSWSFVSRAPGSAAVIANPAAVKPTFVVDAPGTYVVRLIVSDGQVSSPPDTVTITTQNSPPVANAGSDQTLFVTSTAMLDGSGSTDVDGDAITYAWALLSVPAGSSATLNNPSAVRPTFVVDRPGTYVAQLIVNDGTASSTPDTVSITTQNSPPVASAGPDQTVLAGQLVLLDGTASSDADGNPLTFNWSLTSRPPGSGAVLAGATTAGPSFVVDRTGTYVVQLAVNDGVIDSAPDTVTITTTNSTPTANAGSDTSGVPVGSLVVLDGSQSSDPDAGQALSFFWSLITRPSASSATLDGSTTSGPTFTLDVAGDYVAQLIVNDGFVDSAPDTVLIQANTAPLANAGPDQQVTPGATVHLDGSGSSDPDGQSLTYLWELTSTPAGSSASLQDATTAAPSFIADLEGAYLARLTVTDSVGASATDSVVVTATGGAVAPVVTSNPVDQSVDAGTAATFAAAASGSPAPTVQWQASTDGGATFIDVAGATSPTYTLITSPGDDGKRFRAVFTNIAGGAATTSATLTVTVQKFDEHVAVNDVLEINGVPLLDPLADLTVDAETLTAFTATAVDPGDTLVFSLAGAPAGATIDPATGAFSWTPTAAQNAQTYTFSVVVTDSGGLSAARALTITVRPFVRSFDEHVTIDDAVVVNGAPLLDPLTDLTVEAETTAQFTAVAVDPGDTLVFSLIGGPEGATIDPATGVFTWTPVEAQSKRAYAFLVGVTDSGGLIVTRPISIAVTTSISTFTVAATDAAAAELGADPGTFVIARSGSIRRAITVLYDVGGTATPGNDYVALNPGVVIPAGQASVTLTVTPIDDLVGDRDEDVTLALQPGAYLIDTPDSATVTITDNELIVSNTNDSGPDSLRQAMLDANAHAGYTDAIVFDIPGPGPHAILPLSPLPVITDAVIIDATTQSGYTAAQPTIEIDGTNAGGDADGLVITGGHSTIRGLVLNRFGTGEGDGGSGILLQGAGDNIVQQNFIGTDTSGLAARPNRGGGIRIETSSSNIIGGASGQENTIAFNERAGIAVLDGSSNLIQVNAIFSNGGLGIDLGADGVTPNDPGDADAGPNDFQNSPVLTSASSVDGNTTIQGTLNSTPTSPFTLHFFVNPSCNPFPIGQGATFLGSTAGSTDSTGNLNFELAIPAAVATGQFITATAINPGSGTSEFSVCEQVNPFVFLTPDSLNLLTRDRATLTIGSSHPALAGGVTVNLTSGDDTMAAVPASVSIDEGATSATFDLTTGTVAGTTTITASASRFSSGSSQVVVSARSMSLSAPGPLVGVAHTLPGTISLGQPAPAGGVVIALSASDDTRVTPSPATVTIPEGGQSASFTITGVGGGSATLSATAAGFTTATLSITATGSSMISLGSGVVVAPGLDVGLALSIGTPAPAGGLTIQLSSNNTAVATITPSIFIPEGLQVPAANPVVHGVGVGLAFITATAPSYAPDVASVTVTLSASLSPNPLNVIQGQTSNIALNLSAPAPAGGLTFTTSIDDTARATVPASVHVTQGSTAVQVPVTGVAVGDTTLRASAPGIAEATAAISVKSAPVITVGDPTVGKDLQVPFSGTLGAPAPAGNLQVTITSVEPARVLLSTSGTTGGSASITLTVGAGSSSLPSFYVQALAGTGTVQLQTTAPGYATDTSTVTLQTSGFSIQTAGFTTSTSSSNTTVSVGAARLNPDLSVAGTQQLRAGATVNVSIASSNPGVGTIVGSLAFTGGQSSATVQFDPAAAGTSTISLTTPAGFSTPSTGQQIMANVNTSPAINLGDLTVGKDLQASLSGTLAAPAPAGNLDVTVTSLDPGKVLLSTSGMAAGQASITLAVGAGSSSIPGFYVQALAEVGSAQLQTTAQDYATDTSTVTLQPSGFVIQTASFSTTTFAGNRTVSVAPARLNPNIVQPLRGGLPTVHVSIASSETSVGTIVGRLDFNAGDQSQTVEFDPAGGGMSTISLTTPAGFTTPTTQKQITATVTAPDITLSNAVVGRDLQSPLTITLGTAPPTPRTVTVTVQDGNTATIADSAHRLQEGSTTLTFNNVSTTTVGTIYVQGRALGATSVTVQASDYNTKISDITVEESGFYLATSSFTTTTFSPNSNIAVSAARLTAAHAVSLPQELRGGMSQVTVPINNSDPLVGVIIGSAVFNPGDVSKSVAFDPATGGTTSISLTTPGTFTTPTPLSSHQISATVTAPNITIGSVSVGRDLQAPTTISLAAAPPSPVTVTVTSNDANLATITQNRLVAGVSTLTFTNVTSTTVGTIYVQGRAIGDTTITVRAPGYNDGTANVAVDPSGFYIASGAITTTVYSGNNQVSVSAARLNRTTLNVQVPQELRGGLSNVGVGVTSSDAAVGTIIGSPLTFNGGDQTRNVQFDPAGVGTATIAVPLVPPAGFSKPSSQQQILATVNTPNVQISSLVAVGLDLQASVNITLAVAPPAPITVTVASSAGGIATITRDHGIEGGTTLTFTNVTTTTVGTIYVQGRALGDATVTVQAPGYNDGVSNVKVDPSGFYLLTGSFSTPASAANRNVAVGGARLNPTTLNVVLNQEVRGGLSNLSVNVVSSNQAVGPILNAPAIFNGGNLTVNVTFDPIAPGTTTISIPPPPLTGFSRPSNQQQFTVTVTP